MRERDIEEAICRLARSLGYAVRKVSFPGYPGAPDRLFLGDGRLIWMELKRPGGRPSARQLRELQLLRRAGQEAYLVDSVEQAREILVRKPG